MEQQEVAYFSAMSANFSWWSLQWLWQERIRLKRTQTVTFLVHSFVWCAVNARNI